MTTLKNTQLGYYSLIQITPDLARAEKCNVGLVVLSIDEKQGVIFRGYSSYSLELVAVSQLGLTGFDLIISGFVERLKKEIHENPTKETLQNFKASGANPISLGEIRETNIRDFHSDAVRLCERLVSLDFWRVGFCT